LAQGQARKSYNAAIGDSSISGISSGAFMAVQFGFAWSSIIKGVGVSGPFYCAQASAAAMRRIDWAVELMSEKAREQPAFPHRSGPIHRTVQKSTLVNFTSSGMVMLR
jgi:poly(3-hydroxybutyrate) depolymerase